MKYKDIIKAIKFDKSGLVPAIAQQYDSNEVLMMAWMNVASIRVTLSTGQVCYWSRSRKSLWRKGESSGQIQLLKEMRIDCDGDTILLKICQTGVACHTGRKSCFYRSVQGDELIIIAKPLVNPSELYET